MDRYNLIIICFIVAAVFVTLWWTFNAIRRIDNQKNFCAVQLTSVAKLWRKAKFVPEDAKERESLYLYRDFLRKFDEDNGQFPVMVKDGKVRCMTRKEYDNLFGQKTVKAFSVLVTIMAIILAVGSIYVNVVITKTPLIGVAFAVILPMLQLILAIFINRFNKEKNSYRDGIFLALKENSVAFLTITKPFIVVDAYPEKFGKNQKPLYATIGELTQEQIVEVRDFIIRQKAAETKVVLSEVDNEREISRLNEKTAPKRDLKNTSELVKENETQDDSTEVPVQNQIVMEPKAQSLTVEDNELLKFDKINLLNKLADGIVQGEIERASKKAKKIERKEQQAVKPKEVDEVKPSANRAVRDVVAPAEDDFSLDAIGQALDAEIARRNKK